MTRFLDITIFTLFILILFSIGCSEEESVTILAPEADFIAEEFRYVDVDIPVFDLSDLVILNNKSINGIRYEWDFGDGQKSIDFMGNHKYEDTGTYQVSLKVYNSSGESSEVVKTIRVGVRRIFELVLERSEVEFPQNMFLFAGETDNSEKFFLFTLPRGFSREFLPFAGRIDLGERVENSNWFLSLIENVEPLNEFDPGDKLIYGSTFNPYLESPTSFEDQLGSFIIDESKNSVGQISNGFAFRINFILL